MPVPTVLSVDDSSDDAVLLQLACSTAKISFRLQSVESGEEAIAYLEGHGKYVDRVHFPLPRLILLDLKMPGKTGFDVLSWIRASPQLSRIPVVVLTSSVHTEDRARALELGARQYLVKPVGYAALEKLAETVDRILQHGVQQDTAFTGWQPNSASPNTPPAA